jgi:hypothetical protein
LHAEQSIRALEAGSRSSARSRSAAPRRRCGGGRSRARRRPAARRRPQLPLHQRHAGDPPGDRRGRLGQPFAADLVFHNAYGPGKDWFFDPAQSGGGCVIDLGVHLVDLALWALDWPEVGRSKATC